MSSTLSHSPADLEVITIKVGTQKSIITVCAVYVPPNIGDNYQNVLLSYLTEMVSTSDHIIIVGDFNMPDICWSSLSGSTSFSNSFCDFVFKHNLTQLMTTPTHEKGNVLDLVLTNVDDVI